jgi:osmotically-inducible protein OsmY
VTQTAPDNTRINERDREPGTVTPTDQGENKEDLAITQQIRQDIMRSGNLSVAAKNVKVITVSGVVTLRGPVKSPAEKSEIADIAQRVAGVRTVDNQLEVSAG